MNPLDKLLKVINTENIVSEKDVEEVLLGVAGLLKQYKENTEKYTEEKVLEISQGINDFYQFLSEFKADITSENRHVENSIKDQLSEVLKETKSVKKLFDKKYKELLSLELKDGKDADEEKIVEDVLNKIKLPEYKEVVLDNGESIIDKINAVEGEDAPKIDASHIKNLPQTVQQFTGSKLLSTLGDVNIQNPTNGQVIKYDFVARQWYNGSDATGGGAGGGASAYTDLTDATTVNLPTLNTPLQAALAAKATPADISNAISALVDTAPGTLDTLNELAAALGDDPNFATTITTQLSDKASNSNVVHAIGDENVGGIKRFTNLIKSALNAGGIEIYNTADETTNVERAIAQWIGNIFYIQTKKTGTGTGRNLVVGTPSRTITFDEVGASGSFVYSNFSTSSIADAFRLAITRSNTTGQSAELNLSPSINQSGTAGYELLTGNVTETAIGSGERNLINLKVGGITKFKVKNTGQILKREKNIASTATLTPSWDTDDNIFITAQAAAITIANPTGTPTQGQTIMIRIKDNGTARAITYGTNYRAFVAALPTTTTISKTLYLGLVANTTDIKVDITAMSEV